MLVEVVDTALRRREELLAKMRRLRDRSPPGITWHSFNDVDNNDYLFVGVDGSRNMILYRGYALYAVAAESVLARHGRVEVCRRAADVDILIPYWLPEERIRLYMSILELRLALKALRDLKGCVVVLDGSLISMLVRPWKYGGAAHIKYLDTSAHERILDSVKRGELCVASKEIVEEMVEERREVREEALAVEYLEYLTLMYEVLREQEGEVAAIAKQSEAHGLAGGLPDVALYEHYTRGPGYAPGGEVALARLKGSLPAYWEFFRGLKLTVAYVRLERGGPVLRLETTRKEDLPSILKCLSRYSVGGYPYFMAKAHRDVVISNRDMESLARILGLYGMRTGREVLEAWGGR
ncbi:MAG: hypothetical protein DRJ96_00095 [Thermoprotei archaeon]|nr:MAG: hypothetical protein DRJ96_00095 [Thermoprotei archaeon]